MESRIIEINDKKFEVLEAKEIKPYKVGDHVKVLVKEYTDYKPYVGVIIGFDNFENTPTINVAYIAKDFSDAEIRTVSINSQNTDAELAFLNEYENPLKKATVLDAFDKKELKLKADLENIQTQRKVFLDLFGAYFEQKTVA